MENSVKNNSVQVVVKPETEMTVDTVAKNYAKLLKAFEENQDIVIDLNDVMECDTAGIQLLYSVIKTAGNTNKSLSITNISKAVNVAAERVGIKI